MKHLIILLVAFWATTLSVSAQNKKLKLILSPIAFWSTWDGEVSIT